MAKKGGNKAWKALSDKDGAANGEIKPAPRKGPYINLRFRNREQKRAITKAAKAKGMSMNTFCVDVLERAVQ